MKNDSNCSEVYEVRESSAVVIRTRDLSLAQVAYDALVRHNKPVAMFVGIDDGNGARDFEKVESFEPEEVTQPWGRPEVNAAEHAYDMSEATRE